MQAKTQLRIVSLQRARAVAVAESAAEQLAEVDTIWHQIRQHLNSWQTSLDNVLGHCSAQGGPHESASVSSLVSQLLQGKGEMQRMAETLQEVGVGAALTVTELRELRTPASGQGQAAPAHSTHSCTSEHRSLYKLSRQRLTTIEALQTAANRSRAATGAVLERLACGRGERQRVFLLAVLLSWRVFVAKKVLAANSQRLRDADDWAASARFRAIEQASALVQRHAEHRKMWLKRAVFIGWSKQLWLVVRIRYTRRDVLLIFVRLSVVPS